jgi:hypothetical protein
MLGDSVAGGSRKAAQPARGPGGGPAAGGALIALPIALVVPFLIGYLIAVYVIFPPPQDRHDGIAVPDLVGRSAPRRSGARRRGARRAAGPRSCRTRARPPGRSSPRARCPGQQLRAGAAVQVALSGGRPRARGARRDRLQRGPRGVAAALPASTSSAFRRRARGAPGASSVPTRSRARSAAARHSSPLSSARGLLPPEPDTLDAAGRCRRPGMEHDVIFAVARQRWIFGQPLSRGNPHESRVTTAGGRPGSRVLGG